MKYYTIRQNDTIYRLAVYFYYNWRLWKLLYFPNQEIIGADPFTFVPNTRIAVLPPLLQEALHTAAAGDTSFSLAEKYYGTGALYYLIDEANGRPPCLQAGVAYRVPALLTQMEYDAAKELRKEIHVEFDR